MKVLCKRGINLLAIHYRSSFPVKRAVVTLVVLALCIAGLYAAFIFFSPAIAQRFFIKPISVSSLPAPKEDDDRLVIPQLGVNIAYGPEASMLPRSAQWRETNLGNPQDGGTMILVARRLSVQSTPQQTVTYSPFYALDTLDSGDRLVLDYQGIRYGYEVTRVHTGAIGETSVPRDSTDTQLVLFTYDSEDDTSRTIVIAKPLGKVEL